MHAVKDIILSHQILCLSIKYAYFQELILVLVTDEHTEHDIEIEAQQLL